MGQLNVVMTNSPHTAGETDEIVGGLLKTLPIMGQQPFFKWDKVVITPMNGDVKSVARAAFKHLHFHILHPKHDTFHIFQIT